MHSIQPPGEGICQPSLEPSGESAEQSASAKDHTGSPSVEEQTMVPCTAGDDGVLPNAPPSEEGPDHPDTPRVCARDNPSTSCLAFLRRHYQDKEISEKSMELLLASW